MLIPLQLLHHIETAAGMKITRFCKGLRMANIFAQIIVKNIANKELAFAITSSVNKHDYSSSGASIDVYKVTNLIGHIERSSSGDKMNSSCNLQFPTRNFVSIYLVNICQMIAKAVDFRAIQILN